MSASKTLVLGIGNTLLSDEGTGIHVLEFLRQRNPALPGVTWLDGGTLSFTLAPEVESHGNLIVLDAAQLQADTGTVRCLVDAEMDRFLGTNRRSVHEVGLVDLLDMARLRQRLPERRALVGIQPEKLDWGDDPTPAVAAAIPRAAQMVLDLLAEWNGIKP
jgi:hydrogenase maturation protease